MGRYSLKRPAVDRDDVDSNVRVMDDAGYARGTTEKVLSPEIRKFGRAPIAQHYMTVKPRRLGRR